MHFSFFPPPPPPPPPSKKVFNKSSPLFFLSSGPPHDRSLCTRFAIERRSPFQIPDIFAFRPYVLQDLTPKSSFSPVRLRPCSRGPLTGNPPRICPKALLQILCLYYGNTAVLFPLSPPSRPLSNLSFLIPLTFTFEFFDLEDVMPILSQSDLSPPILSLQNQTQSLK